MLHETMTQQGREHERGKHPPVRRTKCTVSAGPGGVGGSLLTPKYLNFMGLY